MSVVVGKKFIPYKAAPPEALATSSSLDEYLYSVRTEWRTGEERHPHFHHHVRQTLMS